MLLNYYKDVFVYENLNKDVNEFLMGRGSCEPLLFTNSIKNIKSFILNS